MYCPYVNKRSAFSEPSELPKEFGLNKLVSFRPIKPTIPSIESGGSSFALPTIRKIQILNFISSNSNQTQLNCQKTQRRLWRPIQSPGFISPVNEKSILRLKCFEDFSYQTINQQVPHTHKINSSSQLLSNSNKFLNFSNQIYPNYLKNRLNQICKTKNNENFSDDAQLGKRKNSKKENHKNLEFFNKNLSEISNKNILKKNQDFNLDIPDQSNSLASYILQGAAMANSEYCQKKAENLEMSKENDDTKLLRKEYNFKGRVIHSFAPEIEQAIKDIDIRVKTFSQGKKYPLTLRLLGSG